MKSKMFILLVLGGLSLQAQNRSQCGVNSEIPDFCNRMRYLRATVNVLEAQTETMQLNYSVMTSMSQTLKTNTEALLKGLPGNMTFHRDDLVEINKVADEMLMAAKQNDPNVVMIANGLSKKCLNCHSSTHPTPGGIPWNDMFGLSWDSISRDCKTVGKNPYLCKSMNAMVSDYNHILAGYLAKVDNYGAVEAMAREFVRILQDLKIKNFVHLGEALRASAEGEAKAVATMASAKDPEVFKRSVALNQTCMNCHNSVGPSSASNQVSPFALGFKFH